VTGSIDPTTSLSIRTSLNPARRLLAASYDDGHCAPLVASHTLPSVVRVRDDIRTFMMETP